MFSKEELEKFYEKLSIKEISEILNVSYWKIYYWMNKYNIPQRSESDIKKLLYKNKRRIPLRNARKVGIDDSINILIDYLAKNGYLAIPQQFNMVKIHCRIVANIYMPELNTVILFSSLSLPKKTASEFLTNGYFVIDIQTTKKLYALCKTRNFQQMILNLLEKIEKLDKLQIFYIKV